MKTWDKLATTLAFGETKKNLEKNGIATFVVETSKEAKQKALEIIPTGAEVMTMQSRSLKETGLDKEIDESGNFDSIRAKMNRMDRATQGREIQKLGAAPEWAIGSVQAVTEDGTVVIASNTGSQVGAYVYGSSHVVWIVGLQKIVRNLDEAMERINDYVRPLEAERLSQVLGKQVESNASKILLFKKEVRPERVTLIFVKEKIGF